MTQLLKEIVTREVIKIADSLEQVSNNHPSLFAGFSGEALFLSELYKLTGDDKYISRLTFLVEEAVGRLSTQALPSSMSGGITGISYLLVHLAKQKLIPEAIINDLEDIDSYINDFAIKNFNEGNWDYLHGGMGALNYFLEHPNVTSNVNIIENYVNSLLKIKTYSEFGWKWKIFNFNEHLRSRPEYNIGLAHGSLSIVSILLKCYKNNILPDQCRLLIYEAIKFITNNALPPNSRSYFPNMGDDERKRSVPLGWCRGDLAIACTLLNVGELFNDEELQYFALEIAHMTLNDTVGKGGYLDACFCHGSSGIAYLYSKLFKQTKEDLFLKQSNYWIKQTLHYGASAEGYIFHIVDRYQKDSSLLNGLAGVGIALVGCIIETESQWDSVFLLS